MHRQSCLVLHAGGVGTGHGRNSNILVGVRYGQLQYLLHVQLVELFGVNSRQMNTLSVTHTLTPARVVREPIGYVARRSQKGPPCNASSPNKPAAIDGHEPPHVGSVVVVGADVVVVVVGGATYDRNQTNHREHSAHAHYKALKNERPARIRKK
jgi:hypothetical protein